MSEPTQEELIAILQQRLLDSEAAVHLVSERCQQRAYLLGWLRLRLKVARSALADIALMEDGETAKARAASAYAASEFDDARVLAESNSASS